MPALFIRMSTPSYSASTRAHSAAISWGSPRSQRMATASRRPAAVCCAPGRLISTMIRRAPASDRSLAHALPMPVAPPVINAVLPDRSMRMLVPSRGSWPNDTRPQPALSSAALPPLQFQIRPVAGQPLAPPGASTWDSRGIYPSAGSAPRRSGRRSRALDAIVQHSQFSLALTPRLTGVECQPFASDS